MNSRVVGLIQLSKYDSLILDLLPSNEGRSTLLWIFLNHYFINNERESDNDNDNDDDDDIELEIVDYKWASKKELVTYHDPGFIDYLLRDRSKRIDKYINPLSLKQAKLLELLKVTPIRSCEEEEEEEEEEDDDNQREEYGLVYDCPIFPRLDEYVKILSGTTLSITQWVIEQDKFYRRTKQVIGLNWSGGRHHGKKFKASGFCYINDINLSILRLRRCYNKVVYLDLDLHHGDGVFDAFKMSSRVMCFSIHRYEPNNGFFPGSGGEYTSGIENYNIPVRKGLNDDNFLWIIENIFIPKLLNFQSDVIVIQLGGDGLHNDTLFKNEWNLTIHGYARVIELILRFMHDKPVVILGGGGYNSLETVKLWTYVVSICLGKTDLDELPVLDNYEEEEYNDALFWGAGNKCTNLPDFNDIEYLNNIRKKIIIF